MLEKPKPQIEYLENSNVGYRAPELNLIAAVLWRAIHDYFHTEGRIKFEARYWLFKAKHKRPFGFLWVCEQLDFQPDGIRQGILAFESRGKAEGFKYLPNGSSDWDCRLRA